MNSVNNKKLSVISAVIIASLIIAGAIASAASASSIAGAIPSVSRGGGAANSAIRSSVNPPVNSANSSANAGPSETPNSPLVNKPPKRKLNDSDVLLMGVCTANITTENGTKYLVIKPEGNSADCVISGSHYSQKLFWNNVYDVISSREADGATLRFEGNVYGYGELIKNAIPDLSGSATGSWGLFENSGIKSLGNIGRFDVSNVTSIDQLFKNCKNLTDVSGLKDWDVSNVETMEQAFNGCNELSDISALSTWNVSKVTSFRVMFGETDLTSDSLKALEDWDVSNVKDMSSLFYNCTYLTNVDALSKWNVGNVTKMPGMFDSCSNLKNADGMKNWNMSNVTYMNGMFQYCYRLEKLDASKWNVSNVTDFRQMFDGCGGKNVNGAVVNFSNKTFNENADMTSAFIDYYGVIIANNWNTGNITYNLKDKYVFGISNPPNSSGSIVITDSNKILTEFKGYKFTTIGKEITIRYKNKNNPFDDRFKDFAVQFNMYAFYNSRIDTNTGKVDKSKPASYDAFAIVKPYVYKLINYYVKLYRNRIAQYELPEYYDIVPSKNIDKTNVMSLFQEYYLAPLKLQAVKGKMQYKADSTLTYNTTEKSSDPVDGSEYAKFGAFKNGIWDEDATSTFKTIKNAVNGITKVGNVKTETKTIKFKTVETKDPTLKKGQTKVKTAGKNGSKKVTTTYAVDPDKGLTTNIESVLGKYIAPVDEVILVGTKEDSKPPTPPTPPSPLPTPPSPLPTPPAPEPPTPPTPPTPPEPSNPKDHGGNEPGGNEPGGNEPDVSHNPHSSHHQNHPHHPDNPDHPHHLDNPVNHGGDTTPGGSSNSGQGINPVWPYIPELNIHGDVNGRPDTSSNNNGDNHRPGSAGGLNSSPNANGSDTGKAFIKNDSTGNGSTCKCSCATNVNSGNAGDANGNNKNGMNPSSNAKVHSVLSNTGSAALAIVLLAFSSVIIGLIGFGVLSVKCRRVKCRRMRCCCVKHLNDN